MFKYTLVAVIDVDFLYFDYITQLKYFLKKPFLYKTVRNVKNRLDRLIELLSLSADAPGQNWPLFDGKNSNSNSNYLITNFLLHMRVTHNGSPLMSSHPRA